MNLTSTLWALAGRPESPRLQIASSNENTKYSNQKNSISTLERVAIIKLRFSRSKD